jgi:hypothetical protein
LVIDDLHWADRSSALLLTHLARDLPGSRILVVAAYRDLEITGDSPAASELKQEIAGLVARGLTNRQIAEVLHIARDPGSDLAGSSALPGCAGHGSRRFFRRWSMRTGPGDRSICR